MRGRICVVTGFTSGIGRVTAARLAGLGATVVGVARDEARGAAAVRDLRSAGGTADLLVADLAVQADVRRLAAEVRDRYTVVDVLLHNAGVAKFGHELTPDGIEATLATNHLAPFLLTHLLRDRLASGSRVVTVASEVHRQVKHVPWDDLTGAAPYRPMAAYNLSKLFNVMFSNELARRLAGTAVTANALSPGFVHTGLAREATGKFKLFFTAVRPFQRSPERGAETPVYLATSPDIAGTTGGYFENCRPAKTNTLAGDEAAGARLWAASERLCGLVDTVH
jgi:retinol dehydrogenase-14